MKYEFIVFEQTMPLNVRLVAKPLFKTVHPVFMLAG